MEAESSLQEKKTRTDTTYIPVRIINEYVYCPRLAYLEWVEKEWDESAETIEGSHTHKRVDSREEVLDEGDFTVFQSVSLTSDELGISGKIDVVEIDEGIATPVDYKRGKRPSIEKEAYEPERVQLCAQGLLLREQGYTCDAGKIYFAGSKNKVHIDFEKKLIEKTRDTIDSIKEMSIQDNPPPPLDTSPKCAGCSLVNICLPDEVNYFSKNEASPRPLAVAQSESLPLIIQSFKAKISKSGETLEISDKDGGKTSVGLADVSQLMVMGSVYITAPCLQELMKREIPVSWYSYGGWFFGHTVGVGHKNVLIRTDQYKKSFNENASLQIAREIISGKISNSRVILRRNWKKDEKPKGVLDKLQKLKKKAEKASSLEELLGIEGAAAAEYFSSFQGMIKQTPPFTDFQFEKRNKRPPKDPVNALLSFSYAMLVRSFTVVLSSIGLDPYKSFYHQERYGRPALALDLMEPFRSIISDSVVISSINNAEITSKDFIQGKSRTALKSSGRKKFIKAFERRLDVEVEHPLFGYKISYRRLFELQSRLFARYLTEEIAEFPHFLTR